MNYFVLLILKDSLFSCINKEVWLISVLRLASNSIAVLAAKSTLHRQHTAKLVRNKYKRILGTAFFKMKFRNSSRCSSTLWLINTNRMEICEVRVSSRVRVLLYSICNRCEIWRKTIFRKVMAELKKFLKMQKAYNPTLPFISSIIRKHFHILISSPVAITSLKLHPL